MQRKEKTNGKRAESVIRGLLILAIAAALCLWKGNVCQAEADAQNAEFYYTFDQTTGTLSFYGTGMLGQGTGIVSEDSNYRYYAYDSFYGFDLVEKGWRTKIKADQVRKVVIGNGITGIYRNFFQSLPNLETVELGSGVCEIQEYAFLLCPSIRTITLDSSNSSLKVVDRGIYSQDGKKLYAYPVADSSPVKIAPGTKTCNPCVFADGKMEVVTIPASMTTLSSGMFLRCGNLKTVHFEKNSQCKKTEYQGMCYGAFEKCGNLQKVKFGECLETLAPATFKDCSSLKEIYLGKAFRGFDSWSVGKVTKRFLSYESEYTDIAFPALEKIRIAKENKVYQTKNNVVFSKDGKKLYCYPTCRKGKFYQVPPSVTVIEAHAFSKNQTLRSVHTGKNTTKIFWYAFSSSKKLSKVVFGKKIKRLERYAFAFCKNLKTAKNLEYVKEIYDGALHRTQIYLITADIRDLTYGTIGMNMTLYLPASKQKFHWKILSGKDKIKVVKRYPNSNRITLRIKKKGKVKIQAVAGRKKWTCLLLNDRYQYD